MKLYMLILIDKSRAASGSTEPPDIGLIETISESMSSFCPSHVVSTCSRTQQGCSTKDCLEKASIYMCHDPLKSVRSRLASGMKMLDEAIALEAPCELSLMPH